MKDVVALRHVPFEDMGSFEEVLREHDLELQYLDYCSSTLDLSAAYSARLLMILGGPISVYDTALYPFLQHEFEMISRRINSGKATLGICLGAQLIAQACGGNVYSSGIHEIGWEPLRLSEQGLSSCLAPLGNDNPMFHWHGDTFDLPPGATLLASTKRIPNQAFSIKDNVLALQFHGEFEASALEQWLVGHACELNLHGISIPQLRSDTAKYGNDLEVRGKEFFRNWVKSVLIS